MKLSVKSCTYFSCTKIWRQFNVLKWTNIHFHFHIAFSILSSFTQITQQKAHKKLPRKQKKKSPSGLWWCMSSRPIWKSWGRAVSPRPASATQHGLAISQVLPPPSPCWPQDQEGWGWESGVAAVHLLQHLHTPPSNWQVSSYFPLNIQSQPQKCQFRNLLPKSSNSNVGSLRITQKSYGEPSFIMFSLGIRDRISKQALYKQFSSHHPANVTLT